ncbi:hypothetical protein BDM02DRAFT_3006216 [Thelephora ganbajun]|uniref:Uncharacterized protein n=1 Tax=Thelephora ganbajun TaxID=370292 RepID=A0ACB6ZAY2_THEGA|nr:hypothetical protein BDM02DRAFT_3006216 [Thelephora ganbajun]
MDEMTLSVRLCTVEDILGTLGPYARDHIQRDGRFEDGLGITVHSSPNFVSIEVSIVNTIEGRTQGVTLAKFGASLWEPLSRHAQLQLCVDFVAHTPGGNVVYFGGNLMDAVRRIVPTMPKIRYLHLIRMSLADRFLQPDPDGPLANEKLLPLLQHLYLEGVTLGDEGWKPLLLYLAQQASSGQRISLTIFAYGRICKDVVGDIEGLVEELTLDLFPSRDRHVATVR